MFEMISGLIDITPSKPYYVGGFAGKHLEIKESNGKLEANFLIIKSEEIIVIISFDLLYVGRELAERIKEGVSNFVKAENLFMVASHTHYAPMTARKADLGRCNPEFVFETAYRVVNAISNAYQFGEFRHTNCTIFTYPSFVIENRRAFRRVGLGERKIKFNSIVLGPSKRKEPINASLVTFFCEDEVVALMWHYSCHPTSLPKKTAFDAHFIGSVRNHLRKKHGRDLPFVFLQGFSGDLRPPSHIRKYTVRSLLRKVIFGPWFEDFSENQYTEWIQKIILEIQSIDNLDKNCGMNSENFDLVKSKRLEIALQELATPTSSNEEKKETVVFHKVDFGIFALIGVSAEVVHDYQTYLDNLEYSGQLLGVGCLGSVFGYIPTAKMLQEGGYESEGYFRYFGIRSLASDIEEKTKFFLREL